MDIEGFRTELKNSDVTEGTQNSYLRALRKFQNQRERNDEPSTEEINAWLAETPENGLTSQGLFDHFKAGIKRYFKFQGRKDEIHELELLPPKELQEDHQKKPDLPSDQDIALLREVAKVSDGQIVLRAQAIIALLATTGIKKQELRQLDTDDIDLDGGVVTVKRENSVPVPLPEKAVQDIREYADNHANYGSGNQDCNAFLMTSDGRISPDQLSYDVNNIAEKAGVKDSVSPQKLGQWAITFLYRSSEDYSIAEIEQFTGRSSISKYIRVVESVIDIEDEKLPFEDDINLNKKREDLVGKEIEDEFGNLAVEELTGQLRDASTDGDHPIRFERVVAAAFSRLGFETKWVGGNGNPDIVITDPVRLTVEARSRDASNSVSQLPTRFIRHKDDYDAEEVVVVGPRFYPSMRQDAENEGIPLITADTLGSLLEITDQHSISPEQLTEILFRSSGEIQEADVEAVRYSVQHDGAEQIIQVIKAIDAAGGSVDDIKHIETALNVMLDTDPPLSHDEIQQCIEVLSHPAISVVDDSEDELQLMTNLEESTDAIERFASYTKSAYRNMN